VSWRWVFIVNVPIGIATIALARPFLTETPRHPARFDLPGALSSALGATAVVYGFIRAASSGWTGGLTLAAFGTGIAALTAFVLLEARARQPILPLALLAKRMRAGAYANMQLARPASRPSGQNAYGVGKTTLLRLLSGLASPTSGDAAILGAAPRQAPAFLAEIGFLAQEIPLYRRLSAEAHIGIGAT
jgi:hypothetical protein